MSTTQLFVELVVIGFGGFIWLSLLLSSFFGCYFQNFPQNISVLCLLPVLCIVYVLGIIIDRISFSLFFCLDESYRKKIFENHLKTTVGDRIRFVLLKSEISKNQIDYNMSRLRICRSWSINFILIGISFTIWNYTVGYFEKYFSFIILLICLILSLSSFFCFIKLTSDYLKNIKSIYNYLKNNP